MVCGCTLLWLLATPAGVPHQPVHHHHGGQLGDRGSATAEVHVGQAEEAAADSQSASQGSIHLATFPYSESSGTWSPEKNKVHPRSQQQLGQGPDQGDRHSLLPEVLRRCHCCQGRRKKNCGGRDRREYITTKKRIVLAITSNHAKNLTGPIAVAAIQRYYNTVTVVKTAARRAGVGEI